jgi:hypothetical protein
METLRPGRTRRMRWLSLVAAPLIALVVAARVAGLTTVAAVLTPLAGIVILALGAGALKARG